MNTPEKIECAGKKKEDGNALYKVGKYARASKKYDKVIMTNESQSVDLIEMMIQYIESS